MDTAVMGHLSTRFSRRLVRQPAAARCDVHFIDLMNAPLPTIDPRIPMCWETAQDLTSVESRVRALPAEHWSDVPDRLARSHRCLVGIHNGAVVHAACAGTGRFKAHLFDRWFQLRPDDAYLYGAYTRPECRGQLIHPASALERLRQIRESGVRRVYWFVDPANHAARRLPARLGAACIGSVGYVEAAGMRLHYLTDIGHLSRSNARFLLEKR
ncbi:MAG: GNAT family N-acetyltransferase [Chloroflexota bacterium]